MPLFKRLNCLHLYRQLNPLEMKNPNKAFAIDESGNVSKKWICKYCGKLIMTPTLNDVTERPSISCRWGDKQYIYYLG